METHGSRSRLLAVEAAAFLALVSVVSVTGACSAEQRARETTTHRAPRPLPPVTAVPTSTPSTLGAGSAAGTGTAHEPDVPAQVYQQVVSALKAGGYRLQSETDLRMVYGRDKKTITVTGRMRGPRSGVRGGEVGAVATIHLRGSDGGWRVTGTR